ncbi:type II secretion system protein GspM [Methylobacterium sp. V23]|uniref:type II secretion system protein GspM n=1 Tax=Methylobacterium sp. V23 TaxID=2044878 RepID=UPI000CDB404E|nr:type II secretion system protein GspM [Methylobacterium sp. V23]POR43709.1 hypothetical protein CRT23_07555 [Methylobacterium sp. V23]
MKRVDCRRFALFIVAHVAVFALLAFIIVSLGRDVLLSQKERTAAATARLALATAIASRHAASFALDPGVVEEAAGRFLRGETASVQTADLLVRLKTCAERHMVTLISVSTLPDIEWQGRTMVGARVEFVTNNARAAAILASIEQGPTLLFIRRVQLQAVNDRAPDVDAIAANLEIYGLPRWPGN